MLPSASAVDSTMVSPLGSTGEATSIGEACSGSILAQTASACAFDSSIARGPFTKSGSELYQSWSARESFLASPRKGQYFGLRGPKPASVCPGAHLGTQASRILSITFAPQACEGGGVSLS